MLGLCFCTCLWSAPPHAAVQCFLASAVLHLPAVCFPPGQLPANGLSPCFHAPSLSLQGLCSQALVTPGSMDTVLADIGGLDETKQAVVRASSALLRHVLSLPGQI